MAFSGIGQRVLPSVAAIVVLSCIWASVARLRRAIAPTAIDPVPLLEALRGDAGRARYDDVCAAIAEDPDADWERELVLAFAMRGEERVMRLNELLLDLDHLVSSGARVPRVCASISATTGFLLASLALRQGLGVASDLPLEIQDYAIHQAVRDGIDVAAVGICGAVVCVTLGIRAAKAAKARLLATDQLIERMEAVGVPGPAPAATTPAADVATPA